MTDQSQIVIYEAEDGQTRIEVRFLTMRNPGGFFVPVVED
jgi:hypothetical protein